MEGREFTFYIRYNTDGWSWNLTDFTVESENGEPINDAVYRRNSKLEEDYNCTLSTVKSNSAWGHGEVLNSILAGDDAYAGICLGARDMTELGQQKVLLDLKTVNTLDLYADYWNPKLSDVLELGGKLYYGMGDLSIVDNRAVRCLYFNKDLFRNLGLDMPYDAVKSGTWTMDSFFELAAQGVNDLNGDGAFQPKERSGIFAQESLGQNFFYASLEQYVSRDKDGLLTLSFDSSTVVDKMQTIAEKLTSEKVCIEYYEDYEAYQRYFTEGQALFLAECAEVIELFRTADFDVGMLPMPKYDEAQDSYCQYADGYCVNLMGIPVTNATPEDTGLILEAMSASSGDLTNAYYDICLTEKSVRDEESKEMLDIIFNNYTIDYADFFDLSFRLTVNTALRGEAGVASTIASIRDAAISELGEINDELEG